MAGGVFRWAAPLFAHAAKRYTEDDARSFARLLGPALSPGGRLLDLGGGTGDLAALLARVVPCAVTVLDASPHMLRYASGLPDVEAVVGDAAAMPFVDGRFDAALVCDAFHHFRAPEAAVRELARVVRPGGSVVVVEIDAGARTTRAIGVVERALGEPAGFLRPDALAALLGAAGIRGSVQRRNGIAYVFTGRVGGGDERCPEGQ
jgi:demethylmenaquinone methyltransferase/2-methoxy-6-polyprenyl-1,4-benzoquinol methylase